MNSCEDCIFVEMDDSGQSGCMVSKLDTYEAIKNAGDMYYTPLKHCFYKRTNDWANKNNGNDLLQVVEDENKLQYSVIIFDSYNLDLSKTIDMIKQFTIQPMYVEIYAKEESIQNTDVYTKIKGFRKWTLRSNINDETNNIETCITNYIHNGYYYPFTLILTENYCLDENKIYDISENIKNNLIFHYIASPNMEAILIPSLLLRYIVYAGFNFKSDLQENYQEWIRLEL